MGTVRTLNGSVGTLTYDALFLGSPGFACLPLCEKGRKVARD
jgi:hypothetical protein